MVCLRLCPHRRLFTWRQRVAHWSVARLQGRATWHRVWPIGKEVGSRAQAKKQPTCFFPVVRELPQAGHWILVCGWPQMGRQCTWVWRPCSTVHASPSCADGRPALLTQRVHWLLTCAMWTPPSAMLLGAPCQFAACAWWHQRFLCTGSVTGELESCGPMWKQTKSHVIS